MLHWLVENCTHLKHQPIQNFWKTQMMELMISSAHSASCHIHLQHMYPHFFISKWVRTAHSGCLVPVSGMELSALYLGVHPNSTLMISKFSAFIRHNVTLLSSMAGHKFCFPVVYWLRLIVLASQPRFQTLLLICIKWRGRSHGMQSWVPHWVNEANAMSMSWYHIVSDAPASLPELPCLTVGEQSHEWHFLIALCHQLLESCFKTDVKSRRRAKRPTAKMEHAPYHHCMWRAYLEGYKNSNDIPSYHNLSLSSSQKKKKFLFLLSS